MKFRLLGAIALSLISSAAAAAVVRVDLTLEYVGRHYDEVKVYDDVTNDLIREIGHLDEVDDEWGLDRATPDFSVGQQLRFQADLWADDWNDRPFGYTRGCRFGTYLDCSGWMVSGLPSSGFAMAWDLYASNDGYFIVGSTQVGSTFSLKAANYDRLAFHDSLFWVFVRDEYANFRVVSDNMAVAPVPLPASAALLPIGFGALSLLRRRRRHKTAGSAS